MCGIAGVIDLSDDENVLLDKVNIMSNVMIKRGPDGHGIYNGKNIAMSMRRLSIIDLEHGWQPFFSDNGNVIVFQNGEIYNFKELRQQLEHKEYIFKSKSDTEVIAHGFVQWGIRGLLERIDGMYAIAILNKKNNTLYLARDRFGEKPLFYTVSCGKFAYASSMKALLALPWVKDSVELKAVDYYLALHYIPGDITFFESIKRVLPGEYLVVPLSNPIPTTFRYYRPDLRMTKQVDDYELSDIIEQAVSSRLIADVPVGVFLSGGIDSSLVAAIAASKQPGIMTFSMGFESGSHDESIAAAFVAKSIGSKHFNFTFNEESFMNLLPKVANELDEPIGDQALLPLYWLCQEASKYVKVVLSGEGADEVFAGYSYYQQFIDKLNCLQNIKYILKYGTKFQLYFNDLLNNRLPITPSGFPLLTDAATRKILIGLDKLKPSTWETEILDWLDTANCPLQRATATDLYTWLPDDLLVKFDRMTMAHSIEGRAPYLNPEVVFYGLSLPSQHRMSNYCSKIALRRVAAMWLPRSICDRPKQGFVLPMRRWLLQWFEANGSLLNYINSCDIDFVDTKETLKLIEHEIGRGMMNERLIFALILLFEWYKNIKKVRFN